MSHPQPHGRAVHVFSEQLAGARVGEEDPVLGTSGLCASSLTAASDQGADEAGAATVAGPPPLDGSLSLLHFCLPPLRRQTLKSRTLKNNCMYQKI